ncbi:MAG: hypothetical protein KME60_34030 [Cyanomargarita calcarea GSE-NOS-MK-12-04C]|jgi:hypothetical protein|uniref:Uncharacterized protein n=1 Tax=Cyanomargarita calcarea GSE-NOS-MK-12-04C TaxID=2839659 RepID=A0A951QUV3_9CYAN|nr:hypothetical protein [Cyanomargarita calcarea GSE-NOS-MK-12-04C]
MTQVIDFNIDLGLRRVGRWGDGGGEIIYSYSDSQLSEVHHIELTAVAAVPL